MLKKKTKQKESGLYSTLQELKDKMILGRGLGRPQEFAFRQGHQKFFRSRLGQPEGQRLGVPLPEGFVWFSRKRTLSFSLQLGTCANSVLRLSSGHPWIPVMTFVMMVVIQSPTTILQWLFLLLLCFGKVLFGVERFTNFPPKLSWSKQRSGRIC